MGGIIFIAIMWEIYNYKSQAVTWGDYQLDSIAGDYWGDFCVNLYAGGECLSYFSFIFLVYVVSLVSFVSLDIAVNLVNFFNTKHSSQVLTAAERNSLTFIQKVMQIVNLNSVFIFVTLYFIL